MECINLSYTIVALSLAWYVVGDLAIHVARGIILDLGHSEDVLKAMAPLFIVLRVFGPLTLLAVILFYYVNLNN